MSTDFPVFTHIVYFWVEHMRENGDWDCFDEHLMFESEEEAKCWIDLRSKPPLTSKPRFYKFRIEQLDPPFVREDPDDI